MVIYSYPVEKKKKKKRSLKRDLLQFELSKNKKEKSIGTFEMISHAVDPFGFGA